jgi:uncharacterized protein
VKNKKLTLSATRVAQIELQVLQTYGIKGIILDLDNTIVSEDDRYLSPGAEVWIQAAQQAGIRFFILSNGKRKYRVNYWAKRLQISALSPARKPLPFSFRRALQYMKCQPHEVVVVGDSLHTDVFGALLAGCSFIQVASLPHPPRWWERLVGRWLQTPYMPIDELWPFHEKHYC